MGDIKSVHYDAFISYKHSELDGYVAEQLHRKLESFRLPKSVRSKVPDGRFKLERVFRDVDELGLTEELSEPINAALANSDYLITICTPRYIESVWCMKEIETFLKTHGRDKILVVLAEGEPSESFPEILTTLLILEIPFSVFSCASKLVIPSLPVLNLTYVTLPSVFENTI